MAGLLVLCVMWPQPARCQSREEMEWLVNTMVRLCLMGGDKVTITESGSAGSDLMLQSHTDSGKLQGEFQVDRSHAEGLIGGIDNRLTSVAAHQATEVRQCLEPLRARLLGMGTPAPKPSVAHNPRPAGNQIATASPAPAVERFRYDPGGIVESPMDFNVGTLPCRWIS